MDFSKNDQLNDQEKVTQIECVSIVSSGKQTKEIISEKSNYFTPAKHNALCGWKQVTQNLVSVNYGSL